VISGKLKRMVKTRNSFLERNIKHVINNLRDAIAASGAFESTVEIVEEEKTRRGLLSDFNLTCSALL
jgi:exosome complex exonuclease RRP6